jgi:AcrR family transcriptional regulator
MPTPTDPADNVDSPEPAVRANYHHGDLRKALVQAARALIADQGPEGFTLREIARQVGVSHRAAYRHFEDKRALLAVVAQEGYQALLAQAQSGLDALPKQASAEQRLVAVLRQYVEFSLAHPAEFVVMTGPRLNLDQRFPDLEAVAAEAFALVKRNVKTLSADAAWGPAQITETTVALLSMTHGISDLVMMNRIQVKDRAIGPLVERLVQGALHGYLPR